MTYQYKIREVDGHNVIAIKFDKNIIAYDEINGVLDEISTMELINPIEYYLVFSGPANRWNGYYFGTNTYHLMNVGTWKEAATGFILKDKE